MIKSREDYKTIALKWIEDWNTRDIMKIMEHYTDDVVFTAPTVIQRWDIQNGTLSGKDALKQHFMKGLELAPNLHFDYIAVLFGVDDMTILYRRESGVLVADVMTINAEGKEKIVHVYQSMV